MKTVNFKPLFIAIGLAAGMGMASGASAVTIPQFQIDPTDTGTITGIYGTQFVGPTSELLTESGGNTLSTTFGYLDLTSLTNDGPLGSIGPVLPGTSKIGVNYNLYLTYSLTSVLATGTFATPGSTYTVTALNFTVWLDPNLDTTFAPAALPGTNASVSVGLPDVEIGFGTLVGTGIAEINSAGGASLNSTTTYTNTAAGANYFVDPVPFYNLAFNSELNNTGGVNIGTNAIAISASGNVSFVKTVPEPASLALLGIGLMGLGVTARRRKAS